jgi:trehalose 6-phosphate synthase/phosphatase
VLVLSEFAGAAQELFSALIVNPYDAKAVAAALTQALAMPREERQTRMRAMRERVMQHDAGEWARRFIDALRSSPSAERGVPHASQVMDRLVDAVRKKRRLALFLDYDGSLREIERTPDAARPHAELIELLDRLDARSDIETTIISGRSVGDLKAFIGHYTQLGLIAEHGAMLRAPGASEWQDRRTELDLRWRDDVRPVLDLHAQSTPGCFVEEKGTSLVWHYRRADPEFGKWKAGELLSELSTMLANMPVSVRHGRKIVEITPQQVSKGAAVMQVHSQRQADLVVVVGDDATDESMFELPDEQIVSIKIGTGDTRAAYQLPTPAALRAFLMRLLDAT